MGSESEIVPRLEKQLADFAIIPDASQWAFGLWVFVRKDIAEKLRNKIASHVEFLKVEDLESIAFSWTYWDKRRAAEITPEKAAQSVAVS